MNSNQDGIILIDKPGGITSAKALNIVKKNLSLKKFGHAGTLDPLATGLLIALSGKATRFARFAGFGLKRYTGTILLGTETDTDDIQGNIIKTSSNIPSYTSIESASKKYLGEILQIPPNISAVKVNGERAYKIAREQILKEELVNLNLKSRTAIISSFNITKFDQGRISFDIVCSSGTYVRSIARDLGKDLDCGGCIEVLRRTEILPFTVNQAKEPNDLKIQDILPWVSLFPNIDIIPAPLKLEKEIMCGVYINTYNYLNSLQILKCQYIALRKEGETTQPFCLASWSEDKNWLIEEIIPDS